jgi:luciferase family oxidoreductase, group 1
MALPLSVLDLSPVDAGTSSSQALHNTIALARLADRLGYTRYWLAEHHNTVMTASPVPEIMIAHVAQATERIRVGSGGVMLPNHAPLHVAEEFRMLEALHPGRIDLGLGRAPGTDPRTALALRRSREALGADDFPEQLAELLAFAQEEEFPAGHPFRSVKATPFDVKLPPIWLLGSSDFSARAAADLGLGFSFAHHINPNFAVPAINIYRQNFRPSKYRQTPHVILTTNVICAETDEQVAALSQAWALTFVRLRTGHPVQIASPEEAQAYTYNPVEQSMVNEVRQRQIAGRPEEVKARLLDLVRQTGADELMISAMLYGFENRAKMLELLATAFALPAAS